MTLCQCSSVSVVEATFNPVIASLVETKDGYCDPAPDGRRTVCPEGLDIGRPTHSVTSD